MAQCSFKVLVAIVLSAGFLGCEPTPVVVTPDADDDTTIVEEREDIEVVPSTDPPAAGTDVNIDVGGGKDGNVNGVGEDAAPTQ